MSDFGMVNVRLVPGVNYTERSKIDTAKDAVEFIIDEIGEYDREVFCVINLNSNGVPINANIVSVGSLNQTMVHPREVFKSSVLSNAAAVILAHNHPSGVIAPSFEDTETTQRLYSAGVLMGIHIVDHIIIGRGGNYYSFAENDKIKPYPDFNEYLDYIDLGNSNFVKLASKAAGSKENVLFMNRTTGSFISAEGYNGVTRTWDQGNYYSKGADELFRAASEYTSNTQKRKIFSQLPYKEKFKAVMELEFPELQENKELLDEMYLDFMEEDNNVSLIDNELYARISSKIRLDKRMRKSR